MVLIQWLKPGYNHLVLTIWLLLAHPAPSHCNRHSLHQPRSLPALTSNCTHPSSNLPQEPRGTWSNDSRSLNCDRLESVAVRYLAYFNLFLFSAAAAPGDKAQSITELWLNVSTQVESQHKLRPTLNGNTVRPSGRLPSPRSKPKGSNQDGTPAVARARLTTSLRFEWRGRRPAL